MSKNILIVESDAALSSQLRIELEAKGCTVEETTDGKGSIELIRRNRPDLVVLAVNLGGGMSGYIVCGKLKKDDGLKSIPVVIIGDPADFDKHRGLKVRADEYVAKPVDMNDFLSHVGGLIGFPAGAEEVLEEETLSPGSDGTDFALDALGDDEAEEIAVEAEPLDLDAAFDDIATSAEEEIVEEVVEAPQDLGADVDVTGEHPSLSNDEADSALDGLGGGDAYDAEDKTTLGFMPDIEESPALHNTPAPLRSAAMGPSDAADLRELRARVAELEGALAEAERRASEATGKAEALEQDLVSRAGELEAARQTGGKSDKDFFALKEANNKKDKEILRLKTELNEKDSELLELRDRETGLEQQLSEASGEAAKRDAQLKTLQARADQLASERKKIDRDLLAAKEEARGASSKLAALQADFDQTSEQLRAHELELDQTRNRLRELEGAHEELERVRAELASREAAIAAKSEEVENQRLQAEQAQIDLEAARNQVTQQAENFAEEMGNLRKQISELEEESLRSEERLTKLYARIKGEEQLKERTKKALAIAQQLLEEAPGDVEIDVEEAA